MGFPCGGLGWDTLVAAWGGLACGLGWDALVVAWGGLGWNALAADLDGMPLRQTWMGSAWGGLGWNALAADLDALVAHLDGIPLWRHGADLDGMPSRQNWKNLAFIMAAKHLACKYQKSGNYIGSNTPY